VRNVWCARLGEIQKKSAGYWGRTVNLSRQQTCRVLKKHNLRYRMCRKKPFISAANALKRLKWAADNEGTDWRRVMFTDECCLKIGEISGQQHCWRADGKAYDPTTMQVHFRPGKSIHIWGAIRYGKSSRCTGLSSHRLANKTKSKSGPKR